ncbi:MFS transporter [Sphingomonas oleivorans]|uniref:MFS transporter n=1 Tax=Sphingomonas oleivorans TaxID=1735121 RepID=A0A2T5FVI7_9SPHN|nr:MFS transporter [Sphingomonas oleivorans]PTQ09791.1 MFS transporter [Sphingomonas oleivorans]
MTAAYSFRPEERPTFPGSPFTPMHSGRRRLGYVAVALLVGIASTLGNGLVSVNVVNLSGALGTYAAETSWLPAIYVATNASANLMLVKARAQFGIPAITHGLLIAYALAGLWQFAFPGFASAVLIRAICGMTAAALTTLTIYNLMQAFPVKLRPLALVFGIGIPQLGMPLARLFPVEMLALGNWQGLHLIELGLALVVLAAISAHPLPPSERSKAFEPLDFVTFGLILPAMTLLCGVLGQGRLLWWTDTPWLGWALAAAVPLFAAAILIEYGRSRPLLQLDWIGSLDIMRFAAVAMMVRMALAEQTYGAVGLLTSGGLTNDQLHRLFIIVAGAMVLGTVTAAMTLSERRLPYQVMAAALIIALGAWLDTDATNITRPAQLYWSQALIAFGSTLFLGPALLYGFLRMVRRGADHLVSFIVLFSVTQNVGGLAGSALLGTYQVASARAHAGALSEHLLAADPLVAARIQGGAATIAAVIADPARQSAQGAALLAQAMTREANILAYNDVFQLVAALALLTALYVGYRILIYAARRRRQALAET